jgi:antitoxin VapB
MSKENVKFEETSSKIVKLRKVIEQKGLSGILLTRQYNICWLTAGSNNHVLFDDQNCLIGILITPAQSFVIAENGDLSRVREEEFSHYPFEYHLIKWYSESVVGEASKIAPGRIGVDAVIAGMNDQVNIEKQLMHLRSVLIEPEIERLRVFGKEASEIMTTVSKTTKPDMRESDVAGALAEELLARGFTISVILIGSNERAMRYRHQVVSGKKIRKHFCFCGVGKKGGLTFPITRIISFGKPPEYIEENQKKVEIIYVYLNSIAKMGTNLKDIYKKLPDIYESAGADRNEWQNHTQGGTMGYLPREQTVSEHVDYILQENNVIGWNPSLPGVMAEDVYLLKTNELEYITYDKGWPHIKVSANGLTQMRPSILVL